jgi:hypothetical protein
LVLEGRQNHIHRPMLPFCSMLSMCSFSRSCHG